MLRQAFNAEQVFSSAERLELGADPSQGLIVMPSRRGSVAQLITEKGPVLVKYADTELQATERDIIPSRSQGIRNEARQMRRLDVGFIPGFLGSIDEPEGVCLATEFIEGPTLSLAAEFSEPPKTVLIAKLIGAVGALHEAGVLHGDIQPGNAIINAHDGLTLIDLEFSHMFDEPALAPGLHTYLSPEAARQITTGVRPILDQQEETFALTATCLSLLTARDPVQAKAHNPNREQELRHIAGGPKYSVVGAHDTDMALAVGLATILESPRIDRPVTPTELLGAISAFVINESQASS